MIGYSVPRGTGGTGAAPPRNKALKAKARPLGLGVGSRGIPWNKEVSNGTPARYRSAN